MKRRFLHSGPPTIQIGGKTYAQAVAVIVFRCAECLGPLKYHNSGIACLADQGHKSFVHRRDAEKIAAEMVAKLEKVEATYVIHDGQLMPREEVLSNAN